MRYKIFNYYIFSFTEEAYRFFNHKSQITWEKYEGTAVLIEKEAASLLKNKITAEMYATNKLHIISTCVLDDEQP